VKWCWRYHTKISLKAYLQKIWVLYHLGYLMCSKFWAPYYLNISMWFEVQNVFGQIWPSISCMWRVFLHYDLIRRSKTRMTFSTHKQKFPCIQFVCYVFFATHIHFCYENDYKWTSGSEKFFGPEITDASCPRRRNQISGCNKLFISRLIWRFKDSWAEQFRCVFHQKLWFHVFILSHGSFRRKNYSIIYCKIEF